ncbi:MAG: hypothetical protein K6F23_16000 [Solobacterium sp.]|nr:hypothetical protein [Solobacterium sp.]
MTHLRGFHRDGTTFGMDVDARRANAVMKKAERITRTTEFGTERTETCLRAPLVASLMGQVAWLITEYHAFTHVQFDDSVKYRVIYPETDEMNQLLRKALESRMSE